MERQAAAAERAEQDRLLLKGSGVWNRRPRSDARAPNAAVEDHRRGAWIAAAG